MKSQVLTVENVLFFSLGIMMVLIVYNMFVSISNEIEKETVEKGMEKLATYLSYEINRIYQIGNKTNSTISLTISLPIQISKKYYFLKEGDNCLYLFVPEYGFRTNLTLYGINAKIRTKYIPSSKRFITIKYSKGRVEIG